MKSSVRYSLHLVLATFLFAAGCSTAPATIDTSEGAEVTFDGLYPVRNARADQAWARPDIDISRYSKIKLQGAGIEYRPGGESGSNWSARSRGGPYEVTEAQKAALLEIVTAQFRRELGNSNHFELTDESGPDVLLVRGALLDVVSYVPPEPAGRSKVYLSRIGEATLVIELRDSITETILARAVDRRAAEPLGGIGLQQSNRAMNTAEVRRVAGSWARALRQGLDDFGTASE